MILKKEEEEEEVGEESVMTRLDGPISREKKKVNFLKRFTLMPEA